jgi:TatD DNase family protein
MHWYSGPLSLIDDALSAGMWFSVNPAMARSKKGTALLQRLPPSRILLETDGPYARAANRPCRPADLQDLVKTLAQAWAVSEETARLTVFNNHGRLPGVGTPAG